MSSDLSSKFLQISLNMREFSERKVYEFENFRLDAESLLLFQNGAQLPLTPKVVATLRALVERHGQVVTKDELMEIVWPDTQVEEGNLTQNLYLLRKTLGKAADGNPFIETLRRRGYRFSGAVSLAPDTASQPARPAPTVIVERKENIYSVIDWQKHHPDSDSELPEPEVPVAPVLPVPSRRVWMLPAVGLMALTAVGLIGFFLFRTPVGGSSIQGMNEITSTQLTDGRDVDYATIAPNGDYFTYHETDGEISRMFVQQSGQSRRTEILPATTSTIYTKTFSPDGQFIYFVTIDKGATVTSLYKIPALGGVQTKIMDNVNSTVAISPDGGQLAFARTTSDASRTEIIIANIDGSAAHTVYVGHDASVIWGGLAWSPDGKSIAFGELDMKTPNIDSRCTISALDVATNTVRDLSPDKWSGCGRMEFMPDNKGMVFIGTRKNDGLTTRRDQLFYLSLETGEARRLTSNGHRHQVTSLGVTRAGAILVVPLNRSSQLWEMDASGKSSTAIQITNGQGDGRAGIAPLPDGTIGYSARAGDSLGVWIANSDGSGAHQIIATPEQTEELRASADGKRFYFSARVDGKPKLFSTAVSGSDQRRELDDDSFDVDSSISPDGNWIAYSSAVSDGATVKHALRKAPLAGGEFIQLTKENSSVPHFSPDGRFISFVDDESIGIINADGSNVATFHTQKTPLLNIGARWTPDGKALVYIVRQGAACNLWKQPLDGSPATPLTDFSNAEIYNFAFTADGQKLILARGYPTRDAVLMKIGN